MTWIRLVTIFAVSLPSSWADARTWTSADGKYRVEAEFIELVENNVHLVRPDGAKLSIPLDKLSDADRTFVQSKTATPGAAPNSLATMLSAARAAMGQSRLSESAKQLELASALATSQSDREQVADALKQQALLSTFWDAAIRVGRRLPAATELQIKQSTVIVIEATDQLLVVRALGANFRFAMDQPHAIPSRLAAALAARGLPGGASHAAISAFSGLNDGENDRDLWEAATGTRLVNEPLPGSVPTDPPVPVGPAPPEPLSPLPPSGNPPNLTAIGSELNGTHPGLASGGFTKPQLPAIDILRKSQEVRQLFAAELQAATTAEGKYALAKKLFDLANETGNEEPAAGFALYVEACRLTAQAGDAQSAFAILDRLDETFQDPDQLRRRAEALTTAIESPASNLTVQFVGSEAWRLIDQAAEEGDFEVANQLADAALSAARRLKDRRAQVAIQKRQQQIKVEEQAFARVAAAEKTLEQNPGDAAANLLVGIHYCTVRNDWSAGLDHLTRSQHTGLATLAQRDLAAPTSIDQQVELGNAWWNLSDAEVNLLGDAVKVRAAHWYKQGLRGLTGLLRVKVEKRIEEAETFEPQAANASPRSTTAF